MKRCSGISSASSSFPRLSLLLVLALGVAPVSAQKQFAETLPIVRRVSLGEYHIIATYDPSWASQEGPREIVLEDFAGREGLTLLLPADAQTRLFVVRMG